MEQQLGEILQNLNETDFSKMEWYDVRDYLEKSIKNINNSTSSLDVEDAYPQHKEKIDNISKEFGEIHDKFVNDVDAMLEKHEVVEQVKIKMLRYEEEEYASIYTPMLDFTGLK